MSWKSKLWSATKTVGIFAAKALVVPWLVNKYVTNKTVKDLLNAAVKQAPVTPSLQKSLDKYVKEQGPQFDEEMAKMQDQLGSLLRRNATLSQQAADARARGLKP